MCASRDELQATIMAVSRILERDYTMALPVGSYHTPFLGYLILRLGSKNHKVGYPKKGVWYEPTGNVLRTASFFRIHVLWAYRKYFGLTGNIDCSSNELQHEGIFFMGCPGRPLPMTTYYCR